MEFGLYGGSGFVMSRPLLEQLGWEHRACPNSSSNADFDMTCAIGDVWQSAFRFVELGGVTNFGNNDSCQGDDWALQEAAKRNSSAVVVHHMTTSGMLDMSDINKCSRPS